MSEVSDATTLMEELRRHAESLGWELVEWDWKDQVDGMDEYQLWVRPLEGEA